MSGSMLLRTLHLLHRTMSRHVQQDIGKLLAAVAVLD